jgi:hypothetical protein
MSDFIGILERTSPGAAKLITSNGPQVPVAFRMDDSSLRSVVGEMPKTALQDGIGTTLEAFRRLRAEGRLG